MDQLLTLPGVARKTANVVLGTWFHKNEGVVVDTHVHRISRRLELTRNDDPKKIEQDLMKIIPREKWTLFSHQIIWHGRKLCIARRPKCADCPLENICHAADKTWSTVEIHKNAIDLANQPVILSGVRVSLAKHRTKSKDPYIHTNRIFCGFTSSSTNPRPSAPVKLIGVLRLRSFFATRRSCSAQDDSLLHFFSSSHAHSHPVGHDHLYEHSGLVRKTCPRRRRSPIRSRSPASPTRKWNRISRAFPSKGCT